MKVRRPIFSPREIEEVRRRLWARVMVECPVKTHRVDGHRRNPEAERPRRYGGEP